MSPFLGNQSREGFVALVFPVLLSNLKVSVGTSLCTVEEQIVPTDIDIRF